MRSRKNSTIRRETIRRQIYLRQFAEDEWDAALPRFEKEPNIGASGTTRESALALAKYMLMMMREDVADVVFDVIEGKEAEAYLVSMGRRPMTHNSGS
jgi:hypothetical protein